MYMHVHCAACRQLNFSVGDVHVRAYLYLYFTPQDDDDDDRYAGILHGRQSTPWVRI